MSGLQKRMRRKLLTQAARIQRKETAGHGPKVRRPIRSWVQTTKFDMVMAVIESQRVVPNDSVSDASSTEVTPE